jgi:general secretion pathway protein A
MEYFTILNLNKEPFSNSPDPDYFFHSQQHVSCLQKLELSLRLKRGLNVVIGDVGTGKTTLCRQLIRKLRKDDAIETHLILDPYFSTPHEFLLTVTELLASDKPDADEDDYQLKERIKKALFQKGVDDDKTTVLIIDEGQKIPEFCLELMREFLNYETNDYKLLQIAIFAQKEFEKALEKHANFTDRINLYHRLEPMSFKDTRNMIQFRLNQSSAATQKLALFTYPALWAIYRATRGYPRKIVNLCHRSVLAMIIQNKTKANLFLVQSCMKRAFEGSGKRSWALMSLVAVLVVAAIVLVPRIIPERPPSLVSVQPESFEIDIAQTNTATVKGTTIPEERAVSHTGQAQAARSEMDAAGPSSDPSPEFADHPSQQNPTSSAASQAPAVKETKDTHTPGDKRIMVPTQHQPPKVLGQLKVQRQETLGGLIQRVYGIFNLQYLYSVLEMNPQITDPNTIDIGDVIVFPAIPLSIKPQGQHRWWIELHRRENMKEAFNLLRMDRELDASSRLIPFWDKSSGLHFSIISNQYYYDQTTAETMLSNLPPEMKSESRLLSVWGGETVFYANPFLGP